MKRRSRMLGKSIGLIVPAVLLLASVTRRGGAAEPAGTVVIHVIQHVRMMVTVQRDPWAGATVYARRKDGKVRGTVTDSSGTAVLTNLRPGRVLVWTRGNRSCSAESLQVSCSPDTVREFMMHVSCSGIL